MILFELISKIMNVFYNQLELQYENLIRNINEINFLHNE